MKKFLISFLIAGALCASAQANVSGLVKPTGVPTLDTTNSLTSNLVAYAFDSGLGYYVLLTPPSSPMVTTTPVANALWQGPLFPGDGSHYAPAAGNSIPSSTTYGNAQNWQGSTWNDGLYGWLADSDASSENNPLQHAWWLSTAPATATQGFTLFCGFMLNPALSPYTQFICGRPWTPDTATCLTGGFQSNTGNAAISAYIAVQISPNNANCSQQIGNTVTVSTGAFHMASYTCQNISLGNATCIFYMDGVAQGPPVTGLNVISSFNNTTQAVAAGFTTAGDFQSGESQFMLGGKWHAQAPALTHVLNGSAYFGGVMNVALTAAQEASLAANPYQIINAPGGGSSMLNITLIAP